MSKILQKLINTAKNKLNQEKLGELKINTSEYRDFLESLANKKCPICKQELKLSKAEIKKQDNTESISYEFVCGHKHHEMSISETIKIWEKLKGKLRTGNNKPHFISLNKTESGRNLKSIDGVSASWIADRKNNKWKHIIKDIKTGKVLHEEDIPLDQHK